MGPKTPQEDPSVRSVAVFHHERARNDDETPGSKVTTEGTHSAAPDPQPICVRPNGHYACEPLSGCALDGRVSATDRTFIEPPPGAAQNESSLCQGDVLVGLRARGVGPVA